jgi:hypothetical protein
VFLSAFASQRTDVPLCKRRTDFLYGSKRGYLFPAVFDLFLLECENRLDET